MTKKNTTPNINRLTKTKAKQMNKQTSKNKQTNKKTNKQTNKQAKTNKQTNKQENKQTNRQTNKKTNKQTNKQAKTNKQTNKQGPLVHQTPTKQYVASTFQNSVTPSNSPSQHAGLHLHSMSLAPSAPTPPPSHHSLQPVFPEEVWFVLLCTIGMGR